jgi:hypothetical protein
MFDERESGNGHELQPKFDMDTLHPAASGVPAEGGYYPALQSFKADKDMQADLARWGQGMSEVFG